MLSNPIFHLSSLIIKFIVRRVNLPFFSIAPTLFSVSRSLIRSEGFFPTIAVLSAVNREIFRRGLFTNLTRNRTLNPTVLTSITSILLGNWKTILDHGDTINKYYKWYVFGIILSNFNKFFFAVFRFLLGLLFGSLGLIFTPDLGSLAFLKDYAYRFIDFIQDHSFLKFYSKARSVVKSTPINPFNITSVSSEVSDGASYHYLSLILFGLGAITISLIIGDYYFHDTVSQVPVVNTFLDGIYNAGSWIKSWFVNTNTPVTPEAIIPESISSSTSTVVPNRIFSPTPSILTPPATPVITPSPTPDPGVNPW